MSRAYLQYELSGGAVKVMPSQKRARAVENFWAGIEQQNPPSAAEAGIILELRAVRLKSRPSLAVVID
jgi:hypothetical protein